MEDRGTERIDKCGENKMTRFMMATVRHMTSISDLEIFQSDGFLSDRVYIDYVGLDTYREWKKTESPKEY
jgi:hypothetical protein